MVIGWDSCDFELILPWIDQGYLPTVKTLIGQGDARRLLSVYPPVTANAWSTIVTGKNAGKHGIFEFASLRDNSYEAVPLNASNRKSKDLWEILGDAGKRVAIIGVPITFPVRKVNGVLVSGFLTPNEEVEYTFPVELKKELATEVPGYETNPSHLFDYARNKDEDQYIDALFKVLDGHIEGTKYIASNKEWDFFMGVFNESDWIQHKFWSAIDSRHHHYTRERADKYGNVIREVYIRLDKALNELIKIAGPSTHVLLISDHGVGPYYKKFITNNFLYQIGLLNLKRTVSTASRMRIARVGINPVTVDRILKTLHLRKLYYTNAKNSWLKSIRRVLVSRDDIDWERTKAFAPFGSGQIFINRKRHFPSGAVEESEYDAVREEIRNRLLKIRDGGSNIIDRVFFKEELYKGQEVSCAPDIQFHCSRGYFPIGSFSEGTTEIIVKSESVSGAHSMHGIFVLRVAAQKYDNSSSSAIALNPEDAKLVDIATTVLHLADVPLPRDLDGASLASLTHPVKLTNEDTTKVSQTEKITAYTKQEQEDIENRLRTLGYV